MSKTALLFSGQGSQYVGMAQDLVQQFPVAAERLEQANSILGYDLQAIMFDGPQEKLQETRYTQPALFVHEAILVDITKLISSTTAVAGHSLGEFSALYAAKVLSFESALLAIKVRAEAMWDTGEKTKGTMAAIVGMDDNSLQQLCAELNGVDGNILVAANYNSPGQIVISGTADYLREKLPLFKERGAKIVKELNVSGAFHSPLMKDAALPLTATLESTEYKDAIVDVYVNTTAKPLTKANELRLASIAQLTHAVQFTNTLQNMWASGITNFIEIGPGKVLQGLVKRTLPEANISGVDTAEQATSIIAK